MMQIPLVDLKAQYRAHQREIDAAIKGIVENATFIGGKAVSDFEAAFAEMFDAPHFIPCANGTDAIYMVLKMMGIGEGDEVITTAHSWISTSEAVGQTGGKAVFVDVDDYYTLDADAIESRITSRTKAIVAVHLCGQPAAMDRITEICKRRGLLLVEDCAQAHLATFNGQKVGTFGDAATFSFFPSKNLGAYGDGGGIIVRDADLAKRVRMYANHGALKRHHHVMEGMNSRLDALQAAILSAKLPFLKDWTARRQEHAAYYNSQLSGVAGISTPRVRDNATHVYHLYMVQIENRDGVKDRLATDGVETAIHYPTALPLLPAYASMNLSAADFPNAARNQGRILSIPLYPELTKDAMDYIVERLVSACKASGGSIM